MTTKTSILNSEHYTWGNKCDGWHLLKSDSLSVIQERMPPGTTEQLHCHRFTQQVFYILSGSATFEINGEILQLSVNESIHVPAKILHKISNKGKEDLKFLVISEPKSHGDRIEIIDYSDDLKEHIKTLNVEWLQKYFRVEAVDTVQLSDPKKEIIDKGGFIVYAKHNTAIVGTVSLLKMENGIYELGKMAVTESSQSLGIGKILMDHCMVLARKIGAKRLVLYSNRKLHPALHVYKKYGFREVDMEPGHYDRADIKMEKVL
jgi:mannose-6-phosphate isomerase-like protein (cupin superfamily)/N-acetylglutamate synthase-like GNAT family acetyltransferase